ncbi:MAG: thiamine-phosphate kinase [Candidatus Saelkia tenebricola]|nr:thiamine-phosphate kinase [Candidatus Saelkia tenebricola]
MKEDKIIDFLKKKFYYKSIPLGIGDDAAVLSYSENKYLLFTTDTIVDGVHFKVKDINLGYIGRKAINVNISDIAAMGGEPLYAVINFGLPKYDKKLISKIFNGIYYSAKKYNVKIVGGDTVRSKCLFLAVSMIGIVNKKYFTSRSNAKEGDIICITGNIGGAVLSGKHLSFTPRLKEAQWIVKNLMPTSMIDVSDGLFVDLGRLCVLSKKGAVLFKENIPISDKATDFKSALQDGEDFELLFTLKSGTKLPKKVLDTNTKISTIGRIIPDKGIYLEDKGKVSNVKIKGYDHFKQD